MKFIYLEVKRVTCRAKIIQIQKHGKGLLADLSTAAYGKTWLIPVLFLFFLIQTPIIAQEQNDTVVPQDSIRKHSVESTFAIADTGTMMTSDTLPVEQKVSKNAIDSKVVYSATDSLRFDMRDQNAFLFNKAQINYENIGLNAGYVEIDFQKNQVFATGVPDSAGHESQLPIFTEGAKKFEARIMTYNYKSKKGLIKSVFTRENEGYLHGNLVKKMASNTTYIRNGWYTTCDSRDHPHFGFRFGKAKVIPDDKIITGPAYLAIENMPTPLMIPFGYFPNRKGRRSGILIPTYGESFDRGFFFENGGYYWGISDYMDLKIVGDIYTRGSWAIKPYFNYKLRYRFSGVMNFSYAVNLFGARGSPDFNRTRDFRIYWVHTQDRKARPNSSFSANVNIYSKNFNQYNPTNTENYLSNTFQSSINYAKTFSNRSNLTLNFNHSQNTLEKTINLTAPQISFSVNQFYPLRKKERIGKLRWYENISVRYAMNAENRLSGADSVIFTGEWWNRMQNGIRHNIPISSSIRILKFLNMTNSVNLNDRMYFQSVRKKFVPDTTGGKYVTDTVNGFVNAFDMSFSSSLTTKLYGMFLLKKGPLKAIRHVLTPTVSFTYTPFIDPGSAPLWRYIENDTNTVNPQRYSILAQGIYGSTPGQKSGVLNFSLGNNLEMKVRNRKDSITGIRKIVLIDNFTIAASYDLAKDSMNWSKVAMSGRTRLYKGIDLQYSSSWDPYARDSLGKRINKYEWDVNRRLLRLENTTWNIGVNWGLNSQQFKKKEKKTPADADEQELEDIYRFWDNYVDWDVPWSFNLTYNFRYTKDYQAAQKKRVSKIIQTLGFNGQINLTPKWKVGVTTGYDFEKGEISYTSLDIYRDLHCWEMRFGWIPKGGRQSWNFTINVKASVLQDLKLNKKKDFRDF